MATGFASLAGGVWAEVSTARTDALVVVAVATASALGGWDWRHLPYPHPLLVGFVAFLLVRMALWGERPKSLTRWVPVLALCLVYTQLDTRAGVTSAVMRLFGTSPADGFMLAADRAIFGQTPALWLDTDRLASPGAMAFWHGWYLLGYFPAAVAALSVVHLKGPKDAFYRVRGRMVWLYLVGYLLYGLVPVTGPFRFEPLAAAFVHPDAGLAFLGAVQKATAAYDCFPSLHAAGSGFFVWAMWPYLSRWWRGAALANAALVIIATLTTRAHYGVDLVAGLAYLLVFLQVAGWVEHRNEQHTLRLLGLSPQKPSAPA